MFTATITITPIEDGEVNEIGLYGLPADSYYNLGWSTDTVCTNGLALLARKVLDKPIEIKKNKNYSFSYNVDLMNISDK